MRFEPESPSAVLHEILVGYRSKFYRTTPWYDHEATQIVGSVIGIP